MRSRAPCSPATRRSGRGWSAGSPSCATRCCASTATRSRSASWLDAIAATAAARAPELARARPRAGDRARLAAPRAAARLRRLHRAVAGTTCPVSPHTCPTSDELGVRYLHLMPLLLARAEAGDNDGGYAVADYRSVRARPRHDGRPRGPRSEQLHADSDMSLVLRPRPQPRGPRARVGAAGPAPARGRGYRDYFYVFPDRQMHNTSTSAPCPRCSPTSPRATSPGTTSCRGLGLDDVQRVPVGRELGQPGRGAARVRRDHPRAGQPGASTCCGSTRSPSCGNGWAPTARAESPRCTRSPRCSGR